MVIMRKAWRSCQRHRGKFEEREKERERERERERDRERERQTDCEREKQTARVRNRDASHYSYVSKCSFAHYSYIGVIAKWPNGKTANGQTLKRCVCING